MTSAEARKWLERHVCIPIRGGIPPAEKKEKTNDCEYDIMHGAGRGVDVRSRLSSCTPGE